MKPARWLEVQTAAREVTVNATGHCVGESHPNCRYSDETVAQARALRNEGLSLRQIARIVGAHRMTVGLWVRGLSRPGAAATIVRPKRVYLHRPARNEQ